MGRIALVLALFGSAACSREPSPISAPASATPSYQVPGDPSQPGVAAPAAPTTAPAAAADDPSDLSGTVGETMSSGGYTYARIDRGTHHTWVAGPETPLTVGAVLARTDGQLMTGFRSETLKRTFDEIYFIGNFRITSPGAAGVAAAAPATASPTGSMGDDIEGTVLETMASGGYTYARLDHAGAKMWIAGPEQKLAVGVTLGKMQGQLMEGFRSNTLNRTFDQIYFVTAFPPGSATAVASTPPAAATPAVADDKVAAAPGGKTVAAVFGAKDTLSGKPVVVRGKVVKLNNGIMGRNWVHLRDGTGAAGTNDLLVTTQDTAQLGDIVTASGTIALKQDFGAGYQYDVVLENSTLAAKVARRRDETKI